MALEAERIIKAINILLDFEALCHQKKDNKTYSVETYHNGRENGLAITAHCGGDSWRSAVFSEYRNSDSIVLYLNNKTVSGIFYDGTLTDEMYDSKEFFDYDNLNGVVERIYRFFNE